LKSNPGHFADFKEDSLKRFMLFEKNDVIGKRKRTEDLKDRLPNTVAICKTCHDTQAEREKIMEEINEKPKSKYVVGVFLCPSSCELYDHVLCVHRG
jgi:hypothetical protein